MAGLRGATVDDWGWGKLETPLFPLPTGALFRGSGAVSNELVGGRLIGPVVVEEPSGAGNPVPGGIAKPLDGNDGGGTAEASDDCKKAVWRTPRYWSTAEGAPMGRKRV
jgi:hypothetical protein